MPVEIDGVEFLTQTEIEELVGVTRQTLWRWRQDGKVPQGHRFRDRQLLFSPTEVEEIRAYAFRMEPAGEEASRDQTSLFP